MEIQFNTKEQFADYLLNNVLKDGDIVTSEFNKITNLDIPSGRSFRDYIVGRSSGGDSFKESGTPQSFLHDIFELRRSPLFKHYESARRAYTWSSFDPDRSARININEHIRELNYDLSEIPADDHGWYSEKYTKHYLDWLGSKSRTASAMITGPARFPTQRNRKALDAEHKKYVSFQDWREKTKKSIARRVEYNKPADQKQAEQWASIKNDIIRLAAVIVGIDNGTEGGLRSLFVSSMVGKIETLARKGDKNLVEKSLSLIEELNKDQKKPIITSRHSVWKLRELVSNIAQDKESPAENEIYSIEGGEIIVNYADDRIQVRHIEKPSKEMIDILKKNSFNWSRFNGCWQRKITIGTKSAIRQIFSVTVK